MTGRAARVMLILLVTSVTGCATITSSETQPVTVTTRSETGQAVELASCTLRNDKGEWQAQTPGFASVRRSSGDLLVECRKEGMGNGLLRAISRARGGMFGNILFGGVPGALIDHGKGTGYDYPDELQVIMGRSVTIDRAEPGGTPAGSVEGTTGPERR